MADKKSFKADQNVTEAFISAVDQPQGDFTPPQGFKLVPETKSARLQLLVSPRLKSYLESMAKAEGTSVNALCNKVLQDYVEGGEK